MLTTQCNMEEIWKEIPGYEGLYEASNLGRVRSVDRIIEGHKENIFYNRHFGGRVLRYHYCRGYRVVSLSKEGRVQTIPIHRCVCLTFLPNPEGLESVNHKSGDKDDNRVENLEWCTTQYNTWHSYHINKRKPSGCKPVKCIETGIIYPSCMAAGRDLNMDNSAIADVANGIYQQNKGYHFAFV